MTCDVSSKLIWSKKTFIQKLSVLFLDNWRTFLWYWRGTRMRFGFFHSVNTCYVDGLFHKPSQLFTQSLSVMRTQSRIETRNEDESVWKDLLSLWSLNSPSIFSIECQSDRLSPIFGWVDFQSRKMFFGALTERFRITLICKSFICTIQIILLFCVNNEAIRDVYDGKRISHRKRGQSLRKLSFCGWTFGVSSRKLSRGRVRTYSA